MNKCSTIIPAAGIGNRFGSNLPKQFLNLGDMTIIEHTVNLFYENENIYKIIITVNPEWLKFIKELFSKKNYNNKLEFIIGGKERQDSVYNALNSEFVKNSEFTLVHDAVRPYASNLLINNIIDAAKIYSAAIPAIKLKDTIKSIDYDDFVLETLNRAYLRKIQTPQGFKTEILINSYKKAYEADFYSTDDSSLVEWAGYKVKVIDGEEKNIKITTKEDLTISL